MSSGGGPGGPVGGPRGPGEVSLGFLRVFLRFLPGLYPTYVDK